MHLRLIPRNAPDSDTPPAPKLTDRQRAIVREYFATGCRTGVAAQRLGISPHRVSEVKALPAAREYLAQLEAAAIDAIVQAQVAAILEPQNTAD